ncbi:MAG: hypothetical protein R3C05_28710 [Pirellulaceae bacterium]
MISNVLTDAENGDCDLIAVENYIGDATPGFDGNPDRTTLPDGDQRRQLAAD